MKIIPESKEYFPAIRKIHLDAFPGDDEAELVDQLRKSGDAVFSFIALNIDQTIGHVMFSKLSAPFRALALAPVAVNMKFRKQGIARKLIEAGLEFAQRDGWECVIILGDPHYYQRFGFLRESAKYFECPYSGPHLLALALSGISLPIAAKISYAKPFDAL